MARGDVSVVNTVGTTNYAGAGTNYLVEANNGALYLFFVNTISDIAYMKSTDNGLSWGVTVVLLAGSVTNFSVWYDRWTPDLTTDLIHIAWTDSGDSDTRYTTIDTASSDTKSTDVVAYLGNSTANGGALSITRSTGGNVYIATMIDAGVESAFLRLPNANVPDGAWDAARTDVFEAATQDQIALVPGFAADNQDIMAIFWDASANEISRKIYDDSANTWGETSIAASMTDSAATNEYPNFSVVCDTTNDQILLAAWSAVDTANADLRFWTVTESAITEKTNVVLNSTDDQGLCAVTINSAGHWIVYYAGKSDGSETYPTAVNVYYKVSTDSGTTWGSETLMTTRLYWVKRITSIPNSLSRIYDGEAVFQDFNSNLLRMTLNVGEYGASY